MHVKEIIRPEVREPFFYGKIISWKFNDSIVHIKARNKYCYRVTLIFESGDQADYQKGGLIPKQRLLKQKKPQLHNFIMVNFLLMIIRQENFSITGYITIWLM